LLTLALAGNAAIPGRARADDPEMTQEQVIQRVLPTVVGILAHARPAANTAELNASSTKGADSSDNGGSETFEFVSSAGSGFVIEPDGVILTNWHVVAGAYEIFVTFSDGTREEAEIINAARLVDLALLRVHVKHPLQAITWGDSNQVEIGESVLAIGNPLGIGTSVTRGIVSALHRNINDTPYDDFIQTDAAINHGNSGGPLFDLHGHVIGVDSAIISPTSANAGLGFALPAYQAQFVIERLKQYGWVRPGWLGLKIQSVTPDMARAIGMAQAHGSVVAWITPDGPASKSKLKVGDVIVRFEEDLPDDERALLRDISGSPPGRQVTLGVIRDGNPIDVPVTLGEWPKMAWEQINAPMRVAPPHWVIPANLGITAVPLTEALRTEDKIPETAAGALVLDVAHGTDAARRGLVPGDVIMQVGDAPVGDQASLLAGIEAVRKAGHDMAMFLIFPKDKGKSEFPSPKWLPLRVSAS
jgi:serine protease Do